MNFKNKNKKNKLPNELIRDILLFSKSRKEIIKEKLLENASKKKVYHFINFDFNENISKYYFKNKKIYNPLNQNFIETKHLKFNHQAEILNYINACGYVRDKNYNQSFIYIPQDIMIKEYLIKKNYNIKKK